ncbi:MAG: hypothetical protein H6551_08250 [Chitinophagales bacterium]|nr:hypothetical protein [Chitinophagaceae bacterium]MCB9065114.1 hypothetical protein [Chitinophagales bacterium]
MLHARILLLSASITLLSATQLFAQDGGIKIDTEKNNESDELLAMLEDMPEKPRYATATFKTTRVVTGHSIENTGKGVLDFRVNHRFGALQGGTATFFGLDDANTRIGFDYGITDWLMVGIGRNTFQKEVDGFTKIKILRQKEGKGMPVSLSYMGAMSVQGMPKPTLPPGQEYNFSNRLYYVNQLLVARKFNKWLSLQLMPTHIHYNLVPTTPEPNDLVAIGAGGRVKISNRVSINAEYYYQVPGTMQNGYVNTFSLGFDIETGGHVFQLMLTNSRAMTERAYIGQTPLQWAFDNSGAIHIGFNISRVFTIVRAKEFQGSRNSTW